MKDNLELKIRINEMNNSNELLQILKDSFKQEGFTIDSIEKEEEIGIAGSEIVLTILLSIVANGIYSVIEPQVKNAIEKIKSKTNINFIVEKPVQKTQKELKENDDEK